MMVLTVRPGAFLLGLGRIGASLIASAFLVLRFVENESRGYQRANSFSIGDIDIFRSRIEVILAALFSEGVHLGNYC